MATVVSGADDEDEREAQRRQAECRVLRRQRQREQHDQRDGSPPPGHLRRERRQSGEDRLFRLRHGAPPQVDHGDDGHHEHGHQQHEVEPDVRHVRPGRHEHRPHVDGRRDGRQDAEHEHERGGPILGEPHQAQDRRHQAADDEHRHDPGSRQRARDQHEERQDHQQQPLPPVQAPDERLHEGVHGSHLRVGVHEDAGRDEDEREVQEGERALDEQVGREAQSGDERADQRRHHHRQFGRLEAPAAQDEGGDHRRQRPGGRRVRAHLAYIAFTTSPKSIESSMNVSGAPVFFAIASKRPSSLPSFLTTR